MQISDSNWPKPEIVKLLSFFFLSRSVSVMFTHGLNDFSQCVNLSASKRKISELAVSSSCPVTPAWPLWGVCHRLLAPGCHLFHGIQWLFCVGMLANTSSECWKQRLEFGGFLWPRQGDLLRWSWQRNLQLMIQCSYEPAFSICTCSVLIWR